MARERLAPLALSFLNPQSAHVRAQMRYAMQATIALLALELAGVRGIASGGRAPASCGRLMRIAFLRLSAARVLSRPTCRATQKSHSQHSHPRPASHGTRTALLSPGHQKQKQSPLRVIKYHCTTRPRVPVRQPACSTATLNAQLSALRARARV